MRLIYFSKPGDRLQEQIDFYLVYKALHLGKWVSEAKWLSIGGIVKYVDLKWWCPNFQKNL